MTLHHLYWKSNDERQQEDGYVEKNWEETVSKLQFLISRRYYDSGLNGLGTTEKNLKTANCLVETEIEYFLNTSQPRYFSVYMIFFRKKWHIKFRDHENSTIEILCKLLSEFV
jgi:hypothetical protein